MSVLPFQPIAITGLSALFPQARSVNDSAAPGSLLPPALAASHPQGKAFTFSLTDTSGTWAVDAQNGTLILQQPLSVNEAASYALTFFVTDASLSTSARLSYFWHNFCSKLPTLSIRQGFWPRSSRPP
jgi:hypothetical protein